MSESEYAQSTRPSSVAPSPPAESVVSSGIDEEDEDLKKVCRTLLVFRKPLIVFQEEEDKEELPEEVKYLEDMVSLASEYISCRRKLKANQNAGQRFERLQSLLEKSQKYSEILHKQMSLVKAKSKVKIAPKKSLGRPAKGRGGGGEAPPKKIKMRVESDEEEDRPNVKEEEEEESFQQSSLISGGTLKGYQLEGVAWMATLWENGISGILGA